MCYATTSTKREENPGPNIRIGGDDNDVEHALNQRLVGYVSDHECIYHLLFVCDQDVLQADAAAAAAAASRVGSAIKDIHATRSRCRTLLPRRRTRAEFADVSILCERLSEYAQ